MKAFYSILYASLRKATQEKLALGLLLFDGSMVYFKMSSRKLAALKTFLPKSDYQVIYQSMDAVKSSILSHSERIYVRDQEIFIVGHKAFALDYINYLSRYKNNLITYSEPKSIDLEVNAENMVKLFENFIDRELESGELISSDHVATLKMPPVEQLSIRFGAPIERHFNVNYTLTSERIPNLLVPVKVDLLGKNGMDVLVRIIDTSSRPEKITNEVSTFYVLKDAYLKNKMPVKDFVIAEEPSPKHKKQHQIWRHIKESGDFNYLDISEISKLREFAEANNVRPLDPSKIEVEKGLPS